MGVHLFIFHIAIFFILGSVFISKVKTQGFILSMPIVSSFMCSFIRRAHAGRPSFRIQPSAMADLDSFESERRSLSDTVTSLYRGIYYTNGGYPMDKPRRVINFGAGPTKLPEPVSAISCQCGEPPTPWGSPYLPRPIFPPYPPLFHNFFFRLHPAQSLDFLPPPIWNPADFSSSQRENMPNVP